MSQQTSQPESLVRRLRKRFSQSVFGGMVFGTVVLGPFNLLTTPGWAFRRSDLWELPVTGGIWGALLGIVVGTVWCLIEIERRATRDLRPATRARLRWTLAIATGISLFAWAVVDAYYPGKPFDDAEWRDRESRHNGARRKMAYRLVAWHVLDGKTRAEVRAMLGYSNWPDDSTLHYFLGHQRTLDPLSASPSCEWLMVNFGEDGRVSRYSVHASSNCGCFDTADDTPNPATNRHD
jgi:hypothetical protein